MNGSTRELGGPGFFRRHPWIVDTVLSLVLLGLGVGDIVAALSTAAWWSLAIPHALLTAASVAAVWLRHRRPAQTLIALAVLFPVVRLAWTGTLENPPLDWLRLDGPQAEVDSALGAYLAEHRLPIGPGLAGLAVLGSVSTRCRTRHTWILLGALELWRVVTTLVWVPREDVLYTLVPTVTLDVLVALVGLNVRSRRQRIDALAERNRQLSLERDMREQLAVSAERTRIAREMHDVVAHSLSVMVTLAEGASAVMTTHPDRAHHALDELASVGRSSLADARRLVGVLRDEPGPTAASDRATQAGNLLEPQPQAENIDELVERFRGAGLPVRYTHAGPPLPGDALLQLAVYRIVQEGLTNVLRHAPGSPAIDVEVLHVPGTVRITVDNETGTRPPTMTGSGRGLVGVRERAAAYDGVVDVGPSRDGWHLCVHLHTHGRR